MINLKVLRRNSGILKTIITKRKRDGLTFIGLSDGTLISLVELKMSLLTSGELSYMVCEGPLQLKLFHDPKQALGWDSCPRKEPVQSPQLSCPQFLSSWHGQMVNRHQSSDSESLHGETAAGCVGSQRGLIMCEETGKVGRGLTPPK